MRIGNKQLPWWALVIVAVSFVAILVVLGAGGGQGPETPSGASSEQTAPAGGEVPSGGESGAIDDGETMTTSTAESGSGGEGSSSRTGTSASAGRSGSPSGDSASEPQAEAPLATGTIIIKYWNDTVSKPPADVIIKAGDATWKPRSTRRSDRGELKPVPLERTVQLIVYPDGLRGKRISVPILLTKDMDANEVDAIHVEIRDDRVKILGNPLVDAQIATGRF